MRKELGKISTVIFGKGGYQDAQFGIWLYFDMNGSGIGDGRGVWQGKPSASAKWTMADKEKAMGKIMLYVEDLMSKAKVSKVEDLKGIPVEVTIDGSRFESFRILTEVL